MQAATATKCATCACPVPQVHRPVAAAVSSRSVPGRCSSRIAAARSPECKQRQWLSPGAAAAAAADTSRRHECTARLCALASDAASTSTSAQGLIHTTWTAPDGTLLEVVWQPAARSTRNSSSGSSSSDTSDTSPLSLQSEQQHKPRPPVVLIHGLFRAAWCWEEALLPALAAAGHDTYALSLRGQGGSDIGSSVAAAAEAAGGVALAVNVADIAAFVGQLGAAPVLVGHSLGGMFVQEYLAGLAAQSAASPTSSSSQTTASTSTTTTTSSGSSSGHTPLPPLAGAVLLASASPGTVMAFGRFVADVGLPEFLYQMYIVFSCAHLRDMGVARYCWWGEGMSEVEERRYFRAVCTSSRVTPYIASEVSAWAPPPASPTTHPSLPPVLALGGGADRIIRPWQVEAAAQQWGAAVAILPGVTHDMMLGTQGRAVAGQVVSWLDELVEGRGAAAAAAVAGGLAGGSSKAAGVREAPRGGGAAGRRGGREVEERGDMTPPLVMGSFDSF